MRRLVLITALALILSFLVYPSAFISPKTTLPDDNDTRLIAYIIGQVQDNLLHLRNPYFGRFFAPYENTLAFSDLFLTSAAITLPFRLLTNSPIVIFNLALLIGFILTFITSYYLLRHLTRDTFAALFGAVLFNLSGYHLSYLPHLQIFSLWPVFLSLYFFLRHRYFLFFLIVTAQVLESVFPVYLIFFSIAIMSFPRNRKFFLYSLFFLPLWLAFLFPYLKLHFTFPEAVRPIRDAAHFSLGFEEIFTKYHSLLFISVFVLSLLLKTKQKLATYHLLLATGLILSLGPVLKIFGHNLRIFGLPIPLPYSLFYYLFPGFNGFRTPSRFIVLAAIAAVIIISGKLAPLAKKLLPQTKFFLLALLLLLLSLEGRFPLPAYPVDITPPPIYQEVKKLPASAIILELPIKLWTGPDHEIESVRSLYSLEHGHRRVNGFSGFSPLAWIDLVEQISTSPTSRLDLEVVNRLKSLGVTHVVENDRFFPLP